MNQRFTYGFATLLGLVPVLAIEGPESLKPSAPPKVVAEDAAVNTPPVEAPREEEVAPPEDLSRAYLGIGTGELPALLAEHLKLQPNEGAVVHTLDPEGPAAKAGLVENDIITRIDGKAVATQDSLREAVTGHKPGEEALIDYIHRGEAKNIRVTLTKAPAEVPRIAGRNLPPVERLRMNGLSRDQAQLLQDAFENSQRELEQLNDDQAMDPRALLGQGMQKRLQEMMRGMENFPNPEDIANQAGANFSFKSSGTIRIMDGEGSVEVNSSDDKKQVRVLGRDGKVQWEGPYNTDEDKAKVPAEYRDRLDHLNIDMNFKGKGIRLMPRQQR